MNEHEPFLPFEVKNSIVQHTMENPLMEICGLITLSADGVYSYERLENVHEEPVSNFRLRQEDQIRVVTDNAVVAYVHSHPNGPNCPSKLDMEIQVGIGKPSVICAVVNGALDVFSFGDHLLNLPLDGRTFRHGVTDCYEAARGWYWQNRGLLLDPFPRSDDWWSATEDNEDMYLRNFESQGFEAFKPNFKDRNSDLHPAEGDALLIQFDGSKVINHCAVYVGNNLIYHHRAHRKSATMPIGYMIDQNYVKAWVRHS